MEYRKLGGSGFTVSAVGLGCNSFGQSVDATGVDILVGKAVDLGITLFDTANTYGNYGKSGEYLGGTSEQYLGAAIARCRHQVLVATKFGHPFGSDRPSLQGGSSRDIIMHSAEASLRRLGTDYIDLYQCHHPDPSTPIDETVRALDDLVRQGKVRYIGHCMFSGWQTVDASWAARSQSLVPFVSAQGWYSVLTRGIEAEFVPACQAHGVGILPFFPLESGLLTGKYQRGVKPTTGTRLARWSEIKPEYVNLSFTDEKFAKMERLRALCADAGCALLDMAVGWLLSKPYVASVIAGATLPAQLEANVKAAAWRPTAELSAKIDEISPPARGLYS